MVRLTYKVNGTKSISHLIYANDILIFIYKMGDQEATLFMDKYSFNIMHLN